MNYKVEFRPLATLEIVEGYEWYETQIAGLGADFLDEIESFTRTILSNPFTYSYFRAPIRQGTLKRFPFTIVYEIFDETIVVYSVFMARRNPELKRTM